MHHGGVDFIKVDDLSRPYHQDEIELIRKAIDKTGRQIVFSTSPGETPFHNAEHVSNHANMWRMVDDVWDTWPHITHLINVAEQWYPYIQPGSWPDCDMIPLGRIAIRGERGNDRQSRLSKDEQHTLMTFFSIFRSPLMFGGDMPSIDTFTLSLLTNKEVLRMHREGTEVKQLFNRNGLVSVLSRNLKTGERYLAIFNLTDGNEPIDVSIPLTDLGISKNLLVKDMWIGRVLGKTKGIVSTSVSAHGCKLFCLK